MVSTEQNRRFAPWSTAAPSYEDGTTPYVSSSSSEDDRVAWPPVIARIRDLDKPVVPAVPPSSPVAKAHTPTKPLPGQTSTQRRRNQNISSRLIALAGIIIFLVAIVPFMHLRDTKPNTKSDSAAALSNPAAPKSDSATPLLGGAAANADPAGKTSNRPSSALPVSLTKTAQSAAAAPPSAPPLLPSPDNKASSADLFAGPFPTMGTNRGAADVGRTDCGAARCSSAGGS